MATVISPIVISPIVISPITIQEIARRVRPRPARPKWARRGPTLTGKADTVRAVTTPTCRVVAVAVAVAVLVGATGTSSNGRRSADREAAIFSNTVNAADGRGVGKWDRRNPGVRTFPARMGKM